MGQEPKSQLVAAPLFRVQFFCSLKVFCIFPSLSLSPSNLTLQPRVVVSPYQHFSHSSGRAFLQDSLNLAASASSNLILALFSVCRSFKHSLAFLPFQSPQQLTTFFSHHPSISIHSSASLPIIVQLLIYGFWYVNEICFLLYPCTMFHLSGSVFTRHLSPNSSPLRNQVILMFQVVLVADHSDLQLSIPTHFRGNGHHNIPSPGDRLCERYPR